MLYVGLKVLTGAALITTGALPFAKISQTCLLFLHATVLKLKTKRNENRLRIYGWCCNQPSSDGAVRNYRLFYCFLITQKSLISYMQTVVHILTNFKSDLEAPEHFFRHFGSSKFNVKHLLFFHESWFFIVDKISPSQLCIKKQKNEHTSSWWIELSMVKRWKNCSFHNIFWIEQQQQQPQRN